MTVSASFDQDTKRTAPPVVYTDPRGYFLQHKQLERDRKMATDQEMFLFSEVRKGNAKAQR